MGQTYQRAGLRGLFGGLIQSAGPASVVLASLATAFVMRLPEDQLLACTKCSSIATGVIHPLVFGSESSFFVELFPTRVRFTAISVGKQLGTILGGGLAPLIATALMASRADRIASVVVYFAALSVVALLAMTATNETRGRAL